MKNFVKLISTFNKIAKNSQFIFVPGFNDLSGNNIPKLVFILFLNMYIIYSV